MEKGSVTEFVKKHIKQSMEGWETKKDVYNAYKRFCRVNDKFVISNGAFGRKFFASGLPVGKWKDNPRRNINGYQQCCYLGVELVGL